MNRYPLPAEQITEYGLEAATCDLIAADSTQPEDIRTWARIEASEWRRMQENVLYDDSPAQEPANAPTRVWLVLAWTLIAVLIGLVVKYGR